MSYRPEKDRPRTTWDTTSEDLIVTGSPHANVFQATPRVGGYVKCLSTQGAPKHPPRAPPGRSTPPGAMTADTTKSLLEKIDKKKEDEGEEICKKERNVSNFLDDEEFDVSTDEDDEDDSQTDKAAFNEGVSTLVSTLMCMATKTPMPKANVYRTFQFLKSVKDDNAKYPKNIGQLLPVLKNYQGPYTDQENDQKPQGGGPTSINLDDGGTTSGTTQKAPTRKSVEKLKRTEIETQVKSEFKNESQTSRKVSGAGNAKRESARTSIIKKS